VLATVIDGAIWAGCRVPAGVAHTLATIGGHAEWTVRPAKRRGLAVNIAHALGTTPDDPAVRRTVRREIVNEAHRSADLLWALGRPEDFLATVELDGIEHARPTDAVLAALADAELIVIGPSNPVISIGPILALPGMREALAGVPAAVVAVSPFVGGRSLKGPTEAFCEFAGIALSASGIARAYEEVLDGLVADEKGDSVPTLVTDTVMSDPAGRERLAREVLEFAEALAR
jgi:2-phospho-L-lactate transferase